MSMLSGIIASRHRGGGYAHYRAITIDHTKVPSNQTNFPVLVSGVYSYLATVANGGEIHNGSGFDIIFAADSVGATKYAFDIDSYDPVTGTVVFWVKLPALSSTVDTVFYMLYSNASISTSQANIAATYSNGYICVQHCNDKSDALGVTSPVDTSMTYANADGIIGAGANFSGGGNINNGNSAIFLPANLTFSAWVNPSSLPNAYNCIESFESVNVGHTLLIKSSGKLAIYISGGSGTTDYDGSGTFTVPTGSWSKISYTWDGTNLNGYVNAVLDGSASGAQSYAGLGGGVFTEIIGLSHFSGRQYSGNMDQITFSSVIRSVDWLLTEFNSEGSPSTFYSVGPEL